VLYIGPKEVGEYRLNHHRGEKDWRSRPSQVAFQFPDKFDAEENQLNDQRDGVV